MVTTETGLLTRLGTLSTSAVSDALAGHPGILSHPHTRSAVARTSSSLRH
jgi:hypothetical protein